MAESPTPVAHTGYTAPAVPTGYTAPAVPKGYTDGFVSDLFSWQIVFLDNTLDI
jgi:hypothetical protein